MRPTLRLLCLILGFVAPAAAADWPQWGGRNERNMVSDEKGLPGLFVLGIKRPNDSEIDPASVFNIRWTARLGSQTYGTPTVAGGRVYVGTNDVGLDTARYLSTGGGRLQCLDEKTGELLWRLVVPRLEAQEEGARFEQMELGVCSSPTVEGDRLYLVTNRCEVLCLDVQGMANGNDGPFLDEGRYSVEPDKKPLVPGPHDADILWRFDMIGQVQSRPHDAANCSPLIVGDTVYVGTGNGVNERETHAPMPQAPSLIALDKRTGRLVAKDDEKIGQRMLHGQWSSPSSGMVNGKTQIFFGGGDGICYAFEPVGQAKPDPSALKRVWSFDCNPREYRFRNGKPIDYLTGDVRRHLGNTGDGTFLGPCEIIATPVFYKNRVYVAIGQDPLHGRGRGLLACIDATGTGDVTATGKIWSYDKLDRSLSTVSIADGLLYIADVAGRVHCLDAETGQCHWVQETHAETWGSTYVVDGRIYLGTKHGLWVLAAGKIPKVIRRCNPGASFHCTPVAANGTLYVTSQRHLWAVHSEPKEEAGR